MNILVVSPHPDDETLGCGGTLLKHRAKNDKVSWLILTNVSEAAGYPKSRVNSRQREITAVAKRYGFSKVIKLDFPTTRLDTVARSELVKAVHGAIAHLVPSWVYAPYHCDAHSDHQVAFDAVQSAVKSFRAPSVKKVLMYEVLSETESRLPLRGKSFVPNSFSDISGYLKKKIGIMRIYKGEMKRHPFPRSEKNIEALALFRGASAGFKYAEAFMILKEVW
ncbi:MAG: PIG-L family deacetylase [Candidatus Omnitrophica bacterium]|nr:PIG-L family deacetylase [Candidatus Omnitrophota bacterium]